MQEPRELYNSYIHSLIVRIHLSMEGPKNQRKKTIFPWICFPFYELNKNTPHYGKLFVEKIPPPRHGWYVRCKIFMGFYPAFSGFLHLVYSYIVKNLPWLFTVKLCVFQFYLPFSCPLASFCKSGTRICCF